jgi:hypothetical protein
MPPTSSPSRFLTGGLSSIYKGGPIEALPLALVGKGITFDSGGISLKPGAVRQIALSSPCRAEPPLTANETDARRHG